MVGVHEGSQVTGGERLAELSGKAGKLQQAMGRAIVGKEGAIELLVIGLVAHGHVLIEDVPGVGKTALAKALARCVGCEFRRIQFTPDLLPSDITGLSLYDPQNKDFQFRPGPIFTQILLADEVNRTTPRTQAALLEAMNDFQVSADGKTYMLPKPFMVVATQNPLEFAGTYPLPESQLDRFMLRIRMGYPSPEQEAGMLVSHREGEPVDHLPVVVQAREILEMSEAAARIRFDAAIAAYLVSIVDRTRREPHFAAGVSPRGSLSLYRAAQARAMVRGRDYVIPDDVKELVVPVLAHRIVERGPRTSSERGNAVRVLQTILAELPVPGG
ncbi:MAG: MoxR family ATPase [Planctomycetes bacterium]|nr:MoxR family ATPase [Planctomycetota bacterium]